MEEYARLVENRPQVCSLGADVWICTGALLVSGSRPLRIGTGAIVAAGAVVTKDVEPYAIVAGVPAKVIGYRFDAETRSRLIDSRWWTKDIDWIKEHINLFNDVEKFLGVVNGQVNRENL